MALETQLPQISQSMNIFCNRISSWCSITNPSRPKTLNNPITASISLLWGITWSLMEKTVRASRETMLRGSARRHPSRKPSLSNWRTNRRQSGGCSDKWVASQIWGSHQEGWRQALLHHWQHPPRNKNLPFKKEFMELALPLNSKIPCTFKEPRTKLCVGPSYSQWKGPQRSGSTTFNQGQ